jgi:hypothetical protein
MIAAVLMYFFPGSLIEQARNGAPHDSESKAPTGQTKKRRKWRLRLSRIAPWLLAIGFFLQLIVVIMQLGIPVILLTAVTTTTNTGNASIELLHFDSRILYLLPFIPIVTRTFLCLRFRSQMSDILAEEEQDRESHMTLILSLAGFSFTGLLGLIVVDATLRLSYKIAIYYLLISFLSFLFSLNVQGYKSKRWHDQISTGIMDAGSLSLILAACYLIGSQHFGISFSFSLIFMAIIAWLTDHTIRLVIQWRYLSIKGGTKSV